MLISVEVMRGMWASRRLVPIPRAVSPPAMRPVFRKDRLRTLTRRHKKETGLNWPEVCLIARHSLELKPRSKLHSAEVVGGGSNLA